MANTDESEHWKSSCTFLRQTLSLCGLGVLILDENNIILQINQAGDALLHGQGNLVGQTLPSSLLGLLSTAEEPPFCRVVFDEYVVRQNTEPFPEIPDRLNVIVFRDATNDYTCEIMREVISHLSEGVVISDESGCLVYCNNAAARMDSIVVENVLGDKIENVYKMSDGSECPLPKAIRERRASLNYRQRYTTRLGKSVDAVANTWPIFRGTDVLGAFNVLQDWSTVSELHKEIIDLREKLMMQESEAAGERKVQGAAAGSRDEAGGEKKGLRKSGKSLLSARYTFADILYSCDSMRRLIEQSRQVARSDSSVLIYGETGTGKELFAQSIHNASPRADGPFLAINCAALPENLLESLLFGSVKGAYTGAENRAGFFEQADHGTLLLDEINSMNILLQAKLLRVLQEGTVRRIGGNTEKRVDVRVLSCTNVPPQQAVAEGRIRQDLFYRLGVVNLNIPPLRERKEDIPLLVDHFIASCNRSMQRSVHGIDSITMEIFQAYSWPGNVRELEHAIEHAMNVLPYSEDIITPEYIPQNLLSPAEIKEAPTPVAPEQPEDSLSGKLQGMERKTICTVLAENHGNISKSARILRLSRQNLQYRIKRYGIDVNEFR